jgi:hypothetical protein
MLIPERVPSRQRRGFIIVSGRAISRLGCGTLVAEFGTGGVLWDLDTTQQGAGEMARKYSKGSAKKVERAMKKRKAGTLKSGRSGKKVTSRKQAIAIGLSEARKEGKKVPKKKTGRKAAKKGSVKKRKTSRKQAARKTR